MERSNLIQTEEYKEGRRAHALGVPADECPYNETWRKRKRVLGDCFLHENEDSIPHEERYCWFMGWYDARHDALGLTTRSPKAA